MKNEKSTFLPSAQIPEPKEIDRLPLKPWWRKVIHAVVLLMGWLLYFDFVWYTLVQGNHEILAFIAFYILACIVLIPIVNILWVTHNISIYKHKPHRTEFIPCEEQYDYDWEKREIMSDWKKMQSSSDITILVDRNKKVYAAN